MTNLVCTILWRSVSGWQSRPDFFDKNELALMADLAYLAQTQLDPLVKAFGTWEPEDIWDLTEGLRNEFGAGVAKFLRAYYADTTMPPLMCDLDRLLPAISEDPA